MDNLYVVREDIPAERLNLDDDNLIFKYKYIISFSPFIFLSKHWYIN